MGLKDVHGKRKIHLYFRDSSRVLDNVSNKRQLNRGVSAVLSRVAVERIVINFIPVVNFSSNGRGFWIVYKEGLCPRSAMVLSSRYSTDQKRSLQRKKEIFIYLRNSVEEASKYIPESRVEELPKLPASDTEVYFYEMFPDTEKSTELERQDAFFNPLEPT